MRIGLAVSLTAVALATAVIFPLRHFAPAVSLGVVYLLAVLLVSTYWGLWLGLGTSVLAAGGSSRPTAAPSTSSRSPGKGRHSS